MSRPAEDRAIVDAGLKALAFDSGPPRVCDEPAATYGRASHEHGRLAVSAATNRLALGDKIRLIPGHCDPTVNPHPSLPRERATGFTDFTGIIQCFAAIAMWYPATIAASLSQPARMVLGPGSL
jgi:D-serine deaminase-like pyridoxal phosphate-dependent protein